MILDINMRLSRFGCTSVSLPLYFVSYHSTMKSLFLILLLTYVHLEVTGDTKQLTKEPVFESDICDSSYSCSDCSTARICRKNIQGTFDQVAIVKCSPQRPYCDKSSGTCVSRRPSKCSAISANSNTDPSGNICNKIFSCFDCRTAQVCRPTNSGLVPFTKLPCTNDSPYCDPQTGTCGSEQSIGCGMKGDFVCTQDGKFPDTDCNRYHLCTNLTSLTFSCLSPNEHYDPVTGRCSGSVPCQSFSCMDKVAMKVPHPLDPRFFAYCGDEGPILIDSCPTPYELNFTSQVCEATCHYNGLLQDIDDCRFYYKCTQVFLTESISYFLKEKKQCPKGQAYDPSQFLCVSDISNIPGCKV